MPVRRVRPPLRAPYVGCLSMKRLGAMVACMRFDAPVEEGYLSDACTIPHEDSLQKVCKNRLCDTILTLEKGCVFL